MTMDAVQIQRACGVLFSWTTGADPGFPIGGFYLFKCAQSAREIFEATPTLSKRCQFSCVFASSRSQFTVATDLWISNLTKVSESTFKHDSTS